MRYAICDASHDLKRTDLVSAAPMWLNWFLERERAQIVGAPDADIVLVSATAAQSSASVPRALRRLGVHPLRSKRQGRQRVILGGNAAMAPATFEKWCDLICVGEGRSFMRTLLYDGYDAAARLPCAWVPGETRDVMPASDFPWNMPPVRRFDGTMSVYLSRGCRRKCLYCATGWQSTYRENNAVAVSRQAAALRAAGHRVNFVTNDLAGIRTEELPRFFSASYSQLRVWMKNPALLARLVGRVKNVRIGVESGSEQIRSATGKPMSMQSLWRLTTTLCNSGVPVKWFLIAGLPGETTESYDELVEVVRRARHDIKKTQVHLSFTAFCPEAPTPLGLAPLDDSYWDRFESFRTDFFKRLYTSRVHINSPQKPPSRLKRAMAAQACGEDRLRRGWDDVDPPNWRVRYPWRHKLRKIYGIYKRRVGL